MNVYAGSFCRIAILSFSEPVIGILKSSSGNRPTFTRSVAIMFLRFTGVGVVGTAAHYALLVVLVEMLGLRPVFGSSLGYLLGAVVNYTLNYRFTFASRKKHTETMPKFYLIAAVGFLFNAVIVYTLANIVGVNYLLAQLVATALVLAWGFAANFLWTFDDKPD